MMKKKSIEREGQNVRQKKKKLIHYDDNDEKNPLRPKNSYMMKGSTKQII